MGVDRCRCRLLRRVEGLTLIELVIVIAILAIMSAIALPRFANAMRVHRLDAASRRLAGDLRAARAAAIMGRTSRVVEFDVAGQWYALMDEADPLVAAKGYPASLSDEAYAGISLTVADFNGQDTVTFDRFGVPDEGGTVVISDGDRAATVTVSSTTGRVTLTMGPP